MIGMYHLSLVGTSHQEKNLPCQDASKTATLPNGWVVLAVADGIGSEPLSQIGSQLAVDTVIDFVEDHYPRRWQVENLQALLRTAFAKAEFAIYNNAKRNEQPTHLYHTTLTVAIYNGCNVVYGHVGDGGIITLNTFGDFTSITTPQKGENCNETYVLYGGEDYWTFGATALEEQICSLALMTDGIYDIAMPSLLKGELYINYIRRFMDRNVLKLSTTGEFIQARQWVETVMTEREREFTHDDKTIAVAMNTDFTPSIREEAYYTEPDFTALHREVDAHLYGELPEVKENIQEKTGAVDKIEEPVVLVVPEVPEVIEEESPSIEDSNKIETNPHIQTFPPRNNPKNNLDKLFIRIRHKGK